MLSLCWFEFESCLLEHCGDRFSGRAYLHSSSVNRIATDNDENVFDRQCKQMLCKRMLCKRIYSVNGYVDGFQRSEGTVRPEKQIELFIINNSVLAVLRIK